MSLHVAEKSVLFVCPGGFELVLVPQSEDYKDVDGRAIKVHAKRINFKKRAFGGRYRGEYVTNKPEEIEFIRNHEWFRSGAMPGEAAAREGITVGESWGLNRFIYESDYNPEEKREGPEVVRRFTDPMEPKETTAAPVDAAPNPLKIKATKLKK